jgi:cell division protein FtsW
MRKLKTKFDIPFFVISMLLFVIGLIVLQSASVVLSFNNTGNSTYYFVHQLLYGGLIGVAVMVICAKIDYHFWQKAIPLILLGSLVLLVCVKVPGIGFTAGGATRWVHFGPIVIQPAEVAKLAVIIYLAAWITNKKHAITDFLSGLLPALTIVGLFALLILWQPDLGSMLVLVGTSVLILFVGGASLKHLLLLFGAGIAAMAVIIKLEPYRMNRITTFLNPDHDPLGIGYQLNQARLAIGSGGWFGYGYGFSRQKQNYLPEVMGDSVFAVMAEELGFIRILLIIGLFVAFVVRGIKISTHAPDSFGKLLGVGIVGYIGLQAVVNIASIIGLLPLTGVPLPFFSYGSSSLIVTLAAVGIMLNISKSAKTSH